MKKSLLAVALLSASTAATANELYNGRVSGMGGAGYVTAGYADGVLYNPSLLANYGESDDGALVLNLGALAQDPDDLIDHLDDLVDLTDSVSYAGNQINSAQVDQLRELLEAVDDKTAQVTGGGSLVIAIPTNLISAALVAKGTFAVSGTPLVDEADLGLLDGISGCLAGANTCTFNPENQLQTEVVARGALVQEIGLALAKSFDLTDGSRLLIGVTPKRVEVDTIVYTASVANFDEDDIDADDYRTTQSATTMDAGVTLIQGAMSYGITVQNISSEEFKAIDGSVYELETRSTAAIGYNNNWLRAEAAVDLNAISVYGFTGKTQMVRAGFEISPLSWLQVRAGYQSDLESTMPDAFTFGLGLSPFDTINLDLAAISGSDDAIGAAMQLGLRF
ncbi:MAG: conjugal transfer protein TraF [Cellvibrio sp.]